MIITRFYLRLLLVAAVMLLLMPRDGRCQQDSPARASNSAAAPTTQATPSPTPESDYWDGEWLTGDWDGQRNRLREKGIELDFRLTQHYQGVANGSVLEHGGYGGKFDTDMRFNMAKLAGWKGLSVQVRTETRWGNFAKVVGTKLIPITYMITPKTSGTVSAISALNFTQLIPLNADKGDFIMFGAGRYYGFDGADSPLTVAVVTLHLCTSLSTGHPQTDVWSHPSQTARTSRGYERAIPFLPFQCATPLAIRRHPASLTCSKKEPPSSQA